MTVGSADGQAGPDEEEAASRSSRPLPGRWSRQADTIATPNGVAPVGSDAGDDESSDNEPPFTANPLTDAIAESTTYRCVPAASSLASNAAMPVPLLNGVLPISDSVPFARIR